MIRLFARHPAAVARTAEIADRLDFDLSALRYEYPDEATAPGRTPQAELTHRTRAGAHERYGGRVPQRVLEHELDLIGQVGYAPYFLTVHDIVRFARGRGILCQGRGLAANSAVCYCLGITAVDPSRLDLLFERFVSAERGEPPDIDVDFEHERREEVIQYIYQKYGRDRAGIAATVISYRARSAIREVGKALGLSLDTVGALAGTVWGWSSEGVRADYVREIGLDPSDRTLGLALKLAREIIDFPRHLSQHVGGFVITRGPLSEVVPIGNAAMEDRTAIEWDKDDLDALGILKVDVLGLGMLTGIRKGFRPARATTTAGKLNLATVPAEDPVGLRHAVQGRLGGRLPGGKPSPDEHAAAASSRATFYDLVIEVAIVRPGPIQGDMVHPYLRRRNVGREQVDYVLGRAESHVLGKTLGVPLFQEQAMRIAIVAAGFTPAEADASYAAPWPPSASFGEVHQVPRQASIAGMIGARLRAGLRRTAASSRSRASPTTAFPKSHAASFALLVYVSARG